MAHKEPCSYCKSYELGGHNFCRMCGRRLIAQGQAKWARLAVAYNAAEKFCGYCGGQKHQCECERNGG